MLGVRSSDRLTVQASLLNKAYNVRLQELFDDSDASFQLPGIVTLMERWKLVQCRGIAEVCHQIYDALLLLDIKASVVLWTKTLQLRSPV